MKRQTADKTLELAALHSARRVPLPLLVTVDGSQPTGASGHVMPPPSYHHVTTGASMFPSYPASPAFHALSSMGQQVPVGGQMSHVRSMPIW